MWIRFSGLNKKKIVLKAEDIHGMVEHTVNEKEVTQLSIRFSSQPVSVEHTIEEVMTMLDGAKQRNMDETLEEWHYQDEVKKLLRAKRDELKEKARLKFEKVQSTASEPPKESNDTSGE